MTLHGKMAYSCRIHSGFTVLSLSPGSEPDHRARISLGLEKCFVTQNLPLPNAAILVIHY